jgi:hypothetical protein
MPKSNACVDRKVTIASPSICRATCGKLKAIIRNTVFRLVEVTAKNADGYNDTITSCFAKKLALFLAVWFQVLICWMETVANMLEIMKDSKVVGKIIIFF